MRRSQTTLQIAYSAVGEKPDTSKRVVVVASDTELRRRAQYQRLAIATAALEVSRRELIDEISDVLYGFDGQVLNPNGSAFEMPDIDDAFGNDGDFRWVSDFIRFAEQPPRQRPQARVLARLRLIDLYFRITKPEQARLIAK